MDGEDTITLPTIISRSEAKTLGLNRYFTGVPCRQGHIAERYVGNNECVICKRARKQEEAKDSVKCAMRKAANAAYEKSPKRKASVAARRAENKEKNKAYKKAYNSTWYAANAEKVRQKAREWQKANPDRVRATKLRNRETSNAYSVAWRAKNPEKKKAQSAAWRSANREKFSALTRNWHARKKSAEGCHTSEDVHRIYQAQNGKCAYCREKVGKKYHVDHIKPLAKGGSNWPANLQILCPSCNHRKKDADPIKYAQRLGLLL